MMKISTIISNYPILELLQNCKTITLLKQIHAQMIATGLIKHTFPISLLLQASTNLSTVLSYTFTIFNQVQNPTIFLHNILITSLIKRDKTHEAISQYIFVLTHTDLRPNSYTYPSLFKACGREMWLYCGRVLHSHVVKFLDPPFDQFVQASLLNFYSCCGKIDSCRYFFDHISQPDLAAWNSILSAYAQNGGRDFGTIFDDFCDNHRLSEEVLHLFCEMQRSLVRPNAVTIVALVSACADLGALSQGMWAHVYLLKKNVRLNSYVGSALISMYSNCGCLEFAYRLFVELSERDAFCYNVMIRALAIHGHGREAVELFEKMSSEGLSPDNVTFLVVMNACSHVGFVHQGFKCFDSMLVDYNIMPTLEHYACLVDLLSRAGRLKEAEDRVSTMPLKPNAILWRSLLAAARVNGDLEVGETALEHLMKLDPETSGNYVLLSNIYASMNRWDDVQVVRNMMKGHDVTKMPGTSIVEVDGIMHEFVNGDKLHPEVEEIYLKVEDLNRRLREYNGQD